MTDHTPDHTPERDPVTGYRTTGHQWNGITELNAPVPRAVWGFMTVTHVVALVILILMPAIVPNAAWSGLATRCISPKRVIRIGRV